MVFLKIWVNYYMLIWWSKWVVMAACHWYSQWSDGLTLFDSVSDSGKVIPYSLFWNSVLSCSAYQTYSLNLCILTVMPTLSSVAQDPHISSIGFLPKAKATLWLSSHFFCFLCVFLIPIYTYMLNFKPSAIPSSALDGCAVHLLPFFTALRVLLFCLSLYFVLSSVVKRVLPSLLFFFSFIPLLVLTFWSFLLFYFHIVHSVTTLYIAPLCVLGLDALLVKGQVSEHNMKLTLQTCSQLEQGY